jgi:beta-galactosidase
VFVYTNHPSAELFINGKSQGVRTKANNPHNPSLIEAPVYDANGNVEVEGTVYQNYRLMWMDAVYEPGEIKVVAYDSAGNPAGEKTVKTAGEPHTIKFDVDRPAIVADGKDLAYVTVSVVDKDGNLCPADQRMIEFQVTGQGWYRAGANGDATCLDLFHKPRMHAFNGMLTAIVQSTKEKGTATLTASAEGLASASVEIAIE